MGHNIWDDVYKCAKDQLIPLARDHLLPFLKETVNMIRGVPAEIARMKDELKSIEVFIHQMDKIADAEKDNTSHWTRARIKQLIEISFRMEDVIDEYIIHVEQQLPDPGCAAGAANYVKTMFLRLQIAYKIQNIKSRINIKETSNEKDHDFPQIQSCSEQGSSSSEVVRNLLEAPLHIDADDVVGFDEPIFILVHWLLEKEAERTVLSVVAMGGQGKTTLAKKVFDSKNVIAHFPCRIWITVSHSYKEDEPLRNMLRELYKLKGQVPPQSIDQMDRKSLVDEVRLYLGQERYVVVFDDVWNIHFWDEIEFAMIDNKNGSKILITTRNMDVVNACTKSSSVKVYELKGLPKEKSLELFNKRAFRQLKGGCCPENLKDETSKIVEKCNGLPLAIVVIGGLLSFKNKSAFELLRFCENLNSYLKKDFVINKILVLSYHDLSYNIKSCMLYFGIYPEDYVVNSKRLIRQWIAEGFVKEETGMTLEEVAEGYLTELIHRNLVQVVSINVDGRAKGCRVHDILHAMILKKFDDLCFCKSISDDGQSTLTGIVRRQSIATNSDNLMESIESSQVRSLLIFKPYPLHESFLRQLPTKCRLLKVLDVEPAGEIIEVPEELGSLIHLKYFSIVKATRERILLPKSIGMLENLETLDLAGTLVIDFPKEICKLRKLRHFLGDSMSLIQLKDGIGGMTSLQTLRGVYLDENEDENDNKVVELIEELGKLNQLKELGLLGVKRKYMSVISSSINKMQQLEKLYIKSTPQSGVIDLHLNVPKLRYLVLHGELEKLPEWIPELQYLVKLKLIYSKLTDDDIMESLKSMPNLLSISLREDAYVGETLHFQNEWFMNLKELYLVGLKNLKSILIGQGALPSLKKLHIFSTPQLKALPTGIQHLKKLEDLDMRDMGYDFMTNFYSAGGSIHWVFRLAPYVHIHTTPGPTWVGGCVSRPDRREDDFKSFSRFFS